MSTERDQPLPTSPASGGDSETESVVVRLSGRTHSVGYVPGETILETVRRGGLKAPFACQAGNCGTCMAHLDVGTATMRSNNVLEADEVDDGWVLTCQAVPTSREVVVDYDS